MKKFFAVVGMLMLFVAPVLADEAAAPAAAVDTSAAPAADAAAAPAAKKAKAGPVIAGDEEGVKKTFGDVSTAWATGDAKAVAAFFTLDSTLINPMGQSGKGRKEIQKVIDGEFAGPMKGTQQTFDDFSIRFYPQPNIALVDCTATVTGMKKPDGTDAEPTKSHIFGVVVNRTGKWQALLIRAYAFLTPPGAADASAAPAAAAPAVKK